MDELEKVSDEVYNGFFVDLYVRCVFARNLCRPVVINPSPITSRCANTLAIDMYEGMGYSVYRRVREYYVKLPGEKGGRDEEDAFGTFLRHLPKTTSTKLSTGCALKL